MSLLKSLRVTVYNALLQGRYSLWRRSPAGRRSDSYLASMRAIHEGKRCFVIGNGPSLRSTPLRELRDEVTIGCNGIFLLFGEMGFKPTYYTVEDVLVATDRREEIRNLTGMRRVFPFDLMKTIGSDQEACWVNFLRHYDGFPRFSDDLESVAFWGGTVTYFNLQLAVHLGCNPIYLVGIDHSYKTDIPVEKQGSVWTSKTDDPNHFDPNYFGKGYRWHDPNVARMEQAYIKARDHAKTRGIQILNATVGGKLEVFPRADIHTLIG